MGHNDLIKKALLVELYKNAPEEIKQIMRTNEEIFKDKSDADKKVENSSDSMHADSLTKMALLNGVYLKYPNSQVLISKIYNAL